ncbi:hypothetical protein [Streptomyces olivaceus]|uniref:hypothetical protein n=1 Tax=Streptomyces olivaceus TaxID=47716 RepID=UPI0004C7EA23|nr:hypothetical protein [Streptomyces olivaceus]MBZ6101169.1 hypothetical protein [Streptomyces olivaceus]
MLTPDMSVAQWWILAVVSGIALAVAGQSLAATKAQRFAAVLPPLAGAVAIGGDTLARGSDGRQALFLFTLVALVLVVLRLLYAPYLSRQLALYREGRRADEVTKGQLLVFLLAFAATTALVAVLIG